MICKFCGESIYSDGTECPNCGKAQPMEGGNGFWDLAAKSDTLELKEKQVQKSDDTRLVRKINILTALCGVFCFISFILLIGNVRVIRNESDMKSNENQTQQFEQTVSRETQFPIEDNTVGNTIDTNTGPLIQDNEVGDKTDNDSEDEFSAESSFMSEQILEEEIDLHRYRFPPSPMLIDDK